MISNSISQHQRRDHTSTSFRTRSPHFAHPISTRFVYMTRLQICISFGFWSYLLRSHQRLRAWSTLHGFPSSFYHAQRLQSYVTFRPPSPPSLPLSLAPHIHIEQSSTNKSKSFNQPSSSHPDHQHPESKATCKRFGPVSNPHITRSCYRMWSSTRVMGLGSGG